MAKKSISLADGQELLAKVKNPILLTWNNIAADAYEIEGGLTNEVAIELCIDADRLTSFTHTQREKEEAEDAEKALDEVISKYDYPTVLRFLSRSIPLV